MIASILLALVLPQASLDRPIVPTAPSPVVLLREPGAAEDAVPRPADVARLTPYLPPFEIAHGGAVLVLPGGGYGHLASHEGEVYARWLNALGFAAYVLEYRLGNAGHRHPAPLRDAAQALAWIRATQDFPIDVERVGVIGSSAGGHLAASISALDPSSPEFVGLPRPHVRPDFVVLCYPVISMRDGLTHQGSRRNLLGDAPDGTLFERLSIEAQVDARFPPAFVWHGADDTVVLVRNSYALADAMSKAGVAHELHVYERAAHGIGLGMREPVGHTTRELHAWTQAGAGWLTRRFGAPLEIEAAPVRKEAPTAAPTPQDPVVRDSVDPRLISVFPQKPIVRGYVLAVDDQRVTLSITAGARHLGRDGAGISVACIRDNAYKAELLIVERTGSRAVARVTARPGSLIVPGDQFSSRPE